MNQVGKRIVQRRYAITAASTEFLRDPIGPPLIAETLAERTSGRTVEGRFLAWRPVGEALEDSTQVLANAITMVMRSQDWEWRFIGRKRGRP